MPKWAKILLIIVGCFVLLGIGVIAAGVYWWNTSGKQFVESSAKAVKEGQDYGKQTENSVCVTEALGRYKRDSSFSGIVSSKLFLSGCLQSSRPTPNFCADVPSRFQFKESAEWAVKQCSNVGLSGDSNCPQLYQSVQEFCEKSGNSTSNENRSP